MKRYIIFYLLLLIFNNVEAQSDFKDAYILKSQTDTIYGEIDNRSYELNSLYCDFRENENDTVTRYFPDDLYAYRFINGKYYISKKIKEELKDTSYFFEYLINGELDVYFLQKPEENTYFVSDDGITLNKLKYSRKIIYKDDKRMLQESNQFIGLLEYYTGEYPILKKDIRRISIPNHKNLIKLSNKYHDLACDGEQCIIYEKKVARKIKLDVSASYNYYTFDRILADEAKYPFYGANILFQLSQKTERVYFGVGYKLSGFEQSNENISSLNLSFNYIHPKDGFSPLFSYSFVLPFFVINTISVGTQYKINRLALFVKTDLNTSMFVLPVSSAIGFGLRFDLR